MALHAAGDPFEQLGTAPPPVSLRAADLLIVAGSVTRRQVPTLRDLYARMLAPRWVIAWGACAISGGLYDNYATVAALDRVLPVDVHVTGCPPSAEDLRAALAELRRRAGDADRDASRRVGSRPMQLRDGALGGARVG